MMQNPMNEYVPPFASTPLLLVCVSLITVIFTNISWLRTKLYTLFYCQDNAQVRSQNIINDLLTIIYIKGFHYKIELERPKR